MCKCCNDSLEIRQGFVWFKKEHEIRHRGNGLKEEDFYDSCVKSMCFVRAGL
jgi:hypothetical protein